MNKRMILGLLGLAFIAGLGVADDLVPVAVSPRAENGKSDPRKASQDTVFLWTAAAKENFNLTNDPLRQQLIDVEAEEGTSNTFYGLGAGNGTMTGGYNSFFGRLAGNSNQSGEGNVFVGREAGKLNTTGRWNTSIGTYAGYDNVNGIENTFIGDYAGNDNTGSRNVFVGNEAGNENVSGSGNVFLGNSAGRYSTASDRLMIDNSDAAGPLIFGDFSKDYLKFNGKVGIKKSPTHLLDVGTSGAYCNGAAWVDGSSREYKENFEELTSAEALRAFEALEPVKFNYKENKGETYLGFIAEDVPDLVAMNDRKGLNAMDMVGLLTKVVQEQQKAIMKLQEIISKLENVSPMEK